MLQTERRADKDRIPHRLLNETLPRIHAEKLTAKQTTIGPSHPNTEVHIHTSIWSPGSLGPWGFYLHLSVSSGTLHWDSSLAAFTRSLCLSIESQKAVNHRTAFDTAVGFYFTAFYFTISIAVKRREVKSKGEKERYKHLNAEFQRIARSNNKASFSDQCKEIEDNNRMGKD